MLWKLDACDLSEAYRSGRATPIETIRQFLQRIERIDRKLNAFTAIAEDLDNQASESEQRIKSNAARSLLEGVPFAIKDNLAVEGLPAAWGSKVFSEDICGHDELPVRRLRDAGAIILGKTNTPEFAVEGYTANALFGVTRNPWNLNLTPGGSSGGPVAAVAAGLATAAIGTDGGGSIRRPAAYTGLWGLKPTIGSVPRCGGLPQILLDFEVVGPLARSNRDLQLIYSVLAGPDRRDPKSRAVPESRHVKCAVDGAKVLYVERFDNAPCDPEILKACDTAADQLTRIGCKVERGSLPFDLTALNQEWSAIAQVGLARMRREISRMQNHASPQYLEMADQGDEVSAARFSAILEAINDLRSSVSQAFADWQIIMTPACAAMPWPAEESFPAHIDGTAVGPRGHAVYTGWVNACGHPAIVIPANPSPIGLPIGFQLVGDLASEPVLLEIAAAFQEARGNGWKWPAIAEAADPGVN